MRKLFVLLALVLAGCGSTVVVSHIDSRCIVTAEKPLHVEFNSDDGSCVVSVTAEAGDE